jgi:hypothetical protein
MGGRFFGVSSTCSASLNEIGRQSSIVFLVISEGASLFDPAAGYCF